MSATWAMKGRTGPMPVDASLSSVRLADRLRAARSHRFVGRVEEVALFRDSLTAAVDDPDFVPVIFLHGQGGIGKSTLLGRFWDEATEAGRPVVYVKGRTMTPSPRAMEDAALEALTQRHAVLLVDDFERCQGLEEWFYQKFLPQLPLGALVVVAGRQPPGVRWRTDLGWRNSLRVVRLDELPVGDAVELLRSEGVPAELHAPVLSFAGGSPVALRLSAEVAKRGTGQRGMTWQPDRDVIAALIRHLVDEVPSPEHRQALEVCAHALTTTEELLAHALPDADAGELFDWLRHLPYIQFCSAGVFPHDVVRDVLETDLRWRDPAGYADLHRRVRAHVVARARTAGGDDLVPAMFAFTHLHRSNGFVSRFLTWRATGDVYEDYLREEDHEQLVELTRGAEGEESAAIAGFWLAERPEAFRVLRNSSTDRPVAFSVWLELDEPDPRHLSADPVTAACWEHCRTTLPLREGERLAVARFLVRQEGVRGPSPVMDIMLHRVFGKFLHAKRLGWSYIVLSDGDAWRPFFSYADQPAIDQAPSVDGRPHSLFAHDWRAVSSQQWLRPSGQRLEPGGLDPQSGLRSASSANELAVLPRQEFDAAVRDAFKNLHQADLLSANTLARTRIIAHAPGPDAAACIRKVLESAAESLDAGSDPHGSYQILRVTYLDARRSQEAAAARLNMPYGTYRRRLQKALTEVSDRLWTRELHDPAPI
ncbi:ATP-binding protein [Streptomyces californicus]|uniref:ATP-binding protein n=1 Tax=Streptomyces californicus TaxID=67351 RepID=UPI00378EDC6D